MEKKQNIGSLFGIPIYLDYSWFLILLFATIVNAGDINASGLSTGNIWVGWLAGFFLALLLFVSVLLHELGHSLVAKNQGIIVNSITLFLFGGIASIDRESKTPIQALQVAIAGPLVSLFLFIFCWSLNRVIIFFPLLHFLLADLARVNLVLAVFNLIPGLPLDGGQILKAIIWKIKGDRFIGVRWAANTGKILGGFAICLGLFFTLISGQISTIWLSLIGWFIWRNAKAYERLNTLQEALVKLVAKDAMSAEFRVINARLSIREFVDLYVLKDVNKSLTYFVASEGRYRGLILVTDLNLIERSDWETITLEKIAHPLNEIPSVIETTPLVAVINQLEKIADFRITVLSLAGAVSGIIDRGDMLQALVSSQALNITAEEIKRVKSEGTYPEGLPLNVIASELTNID